MEVDDLVMKADDLTINVVDGTDLTMNVVGGTDLITKLAKTNGSHYEC